MGTIHVKITPTATIITTEETNVITRLNIITASYINSIFAMIENTIESIAEMIGATTGTIAEKIVKKKDATEIN